MHQKYLFLCRETCKHVLYDGYTIVVYIPFSSLSAAKSELIGSKSGFGHKKKAADPQLS